MSANNISANSDANATKVANNTISKSECKSRFDYNRFTITSLYEQPDYMHELGPILYNQWIPNYNSIECFSGQDVVEKFLKESSSNKDKLPVTMIVIDNNNKNKDNKPTLVGTASLEIYD